MMALQKYAQPFLEQVPPPRPLADSKLNQQLELSFISGRMLLPRRCKISSISMKKKPGLISNPYNAGPALKPVHNSPNSRVCCRDDVVKKMGSALRGNPHPILFWTGERRNGQEQHF